MPNIKFFFNHKLTGADFKNNKAWFTISRGKTTPGKLDEEIEINFDLLIGADGAHSSTRYHLMKYTRMDYQQEYIDTLWCEFHIDAKEVQPGEDPNSRFRIDPNHLHIWPGKDFMFIAIPSFVCLSSPSQIHHTNTPRTVPSPARSSCPPQTSPPSPKPPLPSPNSSTPTSQA
jgi:kynurenine 3-monooxygenase